MTKWSGDEGRVSPNAGPADDSLEAKFVPPANLGISEVDAEPLPFAGAASFVSNSKAGAVSGSRLVD
ncbi:hypothetical protein RBSWK_05504 [Rhodopirellula baltica SWK14]|uniref:Uncharacterized protein n=1 Tax=Rhodopirellula baltica SWK14 TaxID=993516 RepID=L7CA79_RHOBT|nr:hypothetical protein RBSWK_05504 [Rhodopirellula baltica SWK14]